MKKAPCVDCENKGCGAYHDKCELYLAFRDEQRQLQEKKLKARGEREFVYQQVQKMKKYSHKKKGK